MATQDFTGIKVYQGTEPYIFVSYAHKDSDKVIPVILQLQSLGFRVWFDMGIEAGTEWSNNIASHLKECSAFLFFTSRHSAASENCLDEVAYAKTYNKSALMIFLEEDVVLPQGTEMQTARFQRVFYTRHKTVESFVAALIEAPMLQICRQWEFGQPAPVAPVTRPAPIVNETKSKKNLIIIAAAAAAALIIGILCFVFLGGGKDKDKDTPNRAGTYNLTSVTYADETFDADLLGYEGAIILEDDGTGTFALDDEQHAICYDDSKMWTEGDPEEFSPIEFDGDELRMEEDGVVLIFTKD